MSEKKYENIKELIFIKNKKEWHARYDVITEEFFWDNEENFSENHYYLSDSEKKYLEDAFIKYLKEKENEMEIKIWKN